MLRHVSSISAELLHVHVCDERIVCRNAGIGLAVGIGVGSATTFVYLRQGKFIVED